VYLVGKDGLAEAGLDPAARAWAAANGFAGEAGRLLVVPGENGAIGAALFGLGEETGGFSPLLTGALGKSLPEGGWHFGNRPADPELAVLGLVLGGYAFSRYGRKPRNDIRFGLPDGVDADRVRRLAEGVFLARDLINTPTNDMGPEALEASVRDLARRFKAKVSVVKGDALPGRGFPMIHAVGRAGAEAPRLIDLSWGRSARRRSRLSARASASTRAGWTSRRRAACFS
jgi:leucyl aminopeptidase